MTKTASNDQNVLTDKELIELLERDRESGFREAFSMYGKRIYHIAFDFTGNREEAEDVAQEVFIELFRSLHLFRKEAALGTWIYRIAVNKSLELLRSKKRKKRWAFLVSIYDPSFRERTHPEEDDDPGKRMEKNERRQLLQKAIDKLPENQRIAFTLHKIEEMKQQEIADVMDISVTAVESLVHRAKNNLKKAMTEHLK